MKMTQAKKKAFWQSLPATPYILWMALFIIIPLGMVVFFALTDPQGNFTLENIACINLILYIIQTLVIPVCDNRVT